VESTKRVDPVLEMIPPTPILEIARAERVSNTAVESTIARLGIPMNVSPTGRKSVKPADTVRIVQDIRSRLKA